MIEKGKQQLPKSVVILSPNCDNYTKYLTLELNSGYVSISSSKTYLSLVVNKMPNKDNLGVYHSLPTSEKTMDDHALRLDTIFINVRVCFKR